LVHFIVAKSYIVGKLAIVPDGIKGTVEVLKGFCVFALFE